MATLDKLISDLKKLSDSELERVLDALGQGVTLNPEFPLKVVGMSDLEDGVEDITRVIVMDRKIGRKLKAGEEGTQDVIAKAESTSELGYTSTPGGETTISGTTIAAGDLAKAISVDFGPVCKGGAIFLSDGMYFLYHDADVQKVLQEDLTDLQMWINTYFDCDDFAEVVSGVICQHLKGIPYGTLWFKGAGIYHAVNCFYSWDQKKMKVVEPQTDAIYNFDKSKYCPMLVVI